MSGNDIIFAFGVGTDRLGLVPVKRETGEDPVRTRHCEGEMAPSAIRKAANFRIVVKVTGEISFADKRSTGRSGKTGVIDEPQPGDLPDINVTRPRDTG